MTAICRRYLLSQQSMASFTSTPAPTNETGRVLALAISPSASSRHGKSSGRVAKCQLNHAVSQSIDPVSYPSQLTIMKLRPVVRYQTNDAMVYMYGRASSMVAVLDSRSSRYRRSAGRHLVGSIACPTDRSVRSQIWPSPIYQKSSFACDPSRDTAGHPICP